MTDTTDNEYRQQRLANMKKLEELGYKPFGRAFKRTGRLAEIRESFEEGGRVSAAGRLMTVRLMGKSIFADIRDGSDRFQVYAQKDALGEEAFKAFKLLDIGDHIGAEGMLFTTRTGEKTLKVEKWTMLAKALLPLPEKWHGLKDVEARYRQRYLDLVVNPLSRELFDKRMQMIHEIRSYLIGRGFFEVETPMIQTLAGGAAAKPFVTHYSALNANVYLRIAPELYLKRLLVGGYDKVFELNRNFRNEGLSRTHNPEFTMLEIYEAYSDVSGMEKLAQEIIVHVAETIFGTLKVGEEQNPVNLELPWRKVSYQDLIKEKMGENWFELSLEEARQKAESVGVKLEPEWNMTLVTHQIYEKTIEKTLINPTFVMRLPAELIPLARPCEDDASSADVFDLVIGSQEIAPAYTEMNDPIQQRKRLREQANNDAEKIDEDFLTALEHGMPPAGGMGIGIDRLLMVLSGKAAIRDVILFPQLRPKN